MYAYLVHFLLFTWLLDISCLLISYFQNAKKRPNPGKMRNEKEQGMAQTKSKMKSMLGIRHATVIVVACKMIVCQKKTPDESFWYDSSPVSSWSESSASKSLSASYLLNFLPTSLLCSASIYFEIERFWISSWSTKDCSLAAKNINGTFRRRTTEKTERRIADRLPFRCAMLVKMSSVKLSPKR